jgi:hypothetical protein
VQREQKRYAWLLPLVILLVETLIFYRQILFSKNFGIPFDLEGYHQPLADFIAASLRNGHLPLWNPYTYCGVPLYANPQAQLFYPPAWPVFLVGALNRRNLFRALECEVVLHVFLAGAFTYWLLRRLHAGRGAALLGATIFQLGGFFASQTQHLGAMCGSAWLPLAWGAVLLLRDQFHWKHLALLSVAIAMAILAGFPATAGVVAGSSLLLALILVLLRRARWQLLLSMGLASALSLMMAAVELAPAFELSKLSHASLRADWEASGGGVPLRAFVSMVAPNYYQIFDLAKYSALNLPWNPTFLYLYCGVAGLILGVLAIVRSSHRDRLVFTLLAGASALWMLCDSTPIGRALFPLLPKFVRGGLYPEFAMAAFLLAFAILAGLGAEQFLAPRGTALMAMTIVLTAADLIHVGASSYMNTNQGPSTSYAMIGGSRSMLEGVRAMTQETFPPARIDVMGATHSWGGMAPLLRTPTANGDDPLALLRILKVRLCFAAGNYWERYYEVSSPASPVLDLLNIRFLLARSDPNIAGPKFMRREDLPDGTSVYENRKALPRFFFVTSIRAAKDMNEALSFLCAAQFDPVRVAVVENVSEGIAMEPAVPSGAVRTVSYADDEVNLDADTPNVALLVTSEAYYPGWRAWIDGREQPLVLTNAAFRGLWTPAGRHRITMRFRPRILWYGASISLVSILLLAVAHNFTPYNWVRQHGVVNEPR